MQTSVRRVAVVGGVRIPFCRSNTLYSDLTNLEMLTTVLDGLADKFALAGVRIDDVVGGAVVTHSRDFNLAREAVIGSKLHPDTSGVTLIQACGTSLQAALIIAGKIATGETECGIACGSDTVSDAPIVFKRRFAKRLLQLSQQKSLAGKARVFSGLSPSELAPDPPSVAEPRTGLSMGEHCELMAKTWQISREAQDQLAYESHVKAAAAYQEGYLDDLLVPCAGVFRDNNLRGDISLDKMATLKPAFDRSGEGTLTAANSTPLTDGASAVLLASEAWAKARGLPILAYLTYGQSAANDFVAGEGLLMAPTIAVSRMLER
ncbi:MAG: acetyl-CoA C-acyltransferase, partial [Hyphomicrobiaceae bacterium]